MTTFTATAMQTSLGPCPPAREVCPYKGCPVHQGLMCSNQGHCYDGKCYCAVDRSGPACEFPLCDTDDECLDGQFCSDDHECSGGVAPPPTPPTPFSGVTAVRCCPKEQHSCMVFMAHVIGLRVMLLPSDSELNFLPGCKIRHIRP